MSDGVIASRLPHNEFVMHYQRSSGLALTRMPAMSPLYSASQV
jgi:hypothetical protein